MTDTEKVLVAVDGSDGSTRALRWAQEYVTGGNAVLEIVTATDAPPVYGVPGPAGLSDFREIAKEVNEKAMADCTLPAGKVSARVVNEPPRPALEKLSKNADLLVVGSRGHGALSGVLLGSVSTYCVHHAHCAVVVVP